MGQKCHYPQRFRRLFELMETGIIMLNGYEFEHLRPEYDEALAAIIRHNLKKHHLDIPGTVYYDEGLDHLSSFYDREGRAYYVLKNGTEIIGG